MYFSDTLQLLFGGAVAFFFSFFFLFFAMPTAINLLKRYHCGQPIRKEECPPLALLHSKKENIPTMGGGLILTSALLGFFVSGGSFLSFYGGLLLFSTLFLGLVGFADDFYKLKYKNSQGIKSRYKLLFQALFSLFLLAWFYFSPFSQPLLFVGGESISPVTFIQTLFLSTSHTALIYLPLPLAFIWVFCVISGSSNAANLTDGLDGLLTGVLFPIFGVLAFFAFLSALPLFSQMASFPYIEGASAIVLFCSALLGSLTAFLWYNTSPARVFMGDTGSLALGGLAGVVALCLGKELFLPILGFVLVAETLSVILQVLSFKLRKGKRIFLCSPLHHHFEYAGWKEQTIVVRFWILSFIFALLSLLLVII